jgi:putative oxidoreductase
MVVATVVDKSKDIDSLATYTDLIETVYMAVFIWLAVAGAGTLSLDYLILQRHGHRNRRRDAPYDAAMTQENGKESR